VAGAQEAHEAIRPTDPARVPESIKAYLTSDQAKLYNLIWQRFIASQMANAQLDQTSVNIGAGPPASAAPRIYTFRASGSVVRFPGFLKVYREGRDDDEGDELDRGALPALSPDEGVDLLKLWPEQHFTQPPPRYTEPTLVKALEEKGIGRPSTYANILSTIQDREYVSLAEKKFRPTPLGTTVNDLLVEYFPNIVDTAFTSVIEGRLDEVAVGDLAWIPVVAEFYGPLERALAAAQQSLGRVEVDLGRPEPRLTGELCPECGKDLVARQSRYGEFISCSGYPKCKYKPTTAKVERPTTGIKCPTCDTGTIAERRTRKGRTFWGCNRYPDCDYATWTNPVANPV
jgi:DNA topoisomerase-1